MDITLKGRSQIRSRRGNLGGYKNERPFEGSGREAVLEISRDGNAGPG